MSKITSLIKRRAMRKARIRSQVSGTALRPRLSVFRSNKYIYGALVDDTTGKTLLSVTTKGVKADKESAGFTKVGQAISAGKELAKLASGKGISEVVFDRAGYRYTGRVKALADGARAGGLKF